MKTFLSIVLAGSLAVGMSSLSFAQDGGKDGGKGERRAQRGDKAAAGAKVGEAAPGFTLKTAAVDVSFVGKVSGALFVWAMAVLDAYKTARIRKEVWDHANRSSVAPSSSDPR
jgi:hypothetical protein